MIVSNPVERMSLQDLANDPWLNDGYDSIPSPFSELNNDLLRFREQVSKKIEILESQEDSLEQEFKENGLKIMSLIIPIGDECIPLVLDKVERRARSEIYEYQSEPVPKLLDLIYQVEPQIPNTLEEEIENNSIALIEANRREYCSCPVRTESSKNSREEFLMNIDQGKMKGNNWKRRISNWFQKVDSVGCESTAIKTKRRFSFFLKN